MHLNADALNEWINLRYSQNAECVPIIHILLCTMKYPLLKTILSDLYFNVPELINSTSNDTNTVNSSNIRRYGQAFTIRIKIAKTLTDYYAS